MKDHNIYDYLRLGWSGHSADTRMFYVKRKFYLEQIFDKYHLLNDYEGRLVEGLFFDILKPIKTSDRIKCRFKREPIMGGKEGSVINAISFSNDHTSFKYKSKIFIGNCIRKFIPWFWF